MLTTLNAKYIHSSLALRYLQTYAAQKNISTTIEEYTINMPVLDILGRIMKESWQVVGFACYIWNIDMTLHVAQLVKSVAPHIKIVLGGPEVSYTAKTILEKYDYIDFIVQGEGEECFTSLVEELHQHFDGEAFDEQQALKPIAGIMGRWQGVIFGEEEVVEVKELGSIPFPYTEEDMTALAHKIVYYESSRGCPFSCQYCLSGNRNTVRFFPLERTLEELQWFIDHKVKQVKFVDRTFNCAKRHHLPLMTFMKEAETTTNFHLEMEADLIGKEEIELLSTIEKGRIQIEVGVQSTYKPTLDAIHRYNDWDHIQKVIRPIIEAGRVHVHMDLIVGLPYEGYKRFSKSFNDLFSLKPHALQIGFLKMLQGSGVRKMEEHQYVYDVKAPYEVLGNKYLSYDEVRFLKIFEDVFERYYNSEKFMNLFGYLHTYWEEKGASAFAFFESLTKLWIEKGHHEIKLNDKAQVLFLLDSLILLEPEETIVLKDLLQLDTLLAFEGKLKPEELGFKEQTTIERESSEAFWRNEELVSTYIAGYRFKDWTRIRRRYQELSLTNKALDYLELKEGTLIVDVQRKTPFFVRP